MSVTIRDAIAHMIAQLDITEQCIAGAEDPKARAILQNSAECFRIAIAAMQGGLPSNADRIRAMSDEELANLLLDGCRGSKCEDQPQNEHGSVCCFECRMKWLSQPAEEE